MRGLFVTFEGIDRSGKTTQAGLLVDALGDDALGVREPGGTPAGERVREILKDPSVALSPEAEALLFAAARSELVADVILPAAAQPQVDAIAATLPALRQTLDRVDTLDPCAQDARRLMSIHLPGLIERYANVPSAYRQQQDGEGKTVDERLVESLAAARTALSDVSERLARQDMAAFETQGRFIKSRYGEQGIESEDGSNT